MIFSKDERFLCLATNVCQNHEHMPLAMMPFIIILGADFREAACPFRISLISTKFAETIVPFTNG